MKTLRPLKNLRLTVILALLTSVVITTVFRIAAHSEFAALRAVLLVGHFDVTNGDQSVTVVNSNPNALCAMFYVFDNNEELQECCGCPVIGDGPRVLSVENDLISNPLNNFSFTTGVVEIVSSYATQNNTQFGNQGCDPARLPANGASLVPALRAWSSAVNVSNNLTALSQDEFLPLNNFPNSKLNQLSSLCGAIETTGSGSNAGVCSCGSGSTPTAVNFPTPTVTSSATVSPSPFRGSPTRSATPTISGSPARSRTATPTRTSRPSASPTPCTTLLQNGQTDCQIGGDCCSGKCDLRDSVCKACIPAGDRFCASNSDCCSGLCSHGTCQ